MAKPVSIPNSFATSTSAIPLSYLDQDFNALANSTNDLATYSNYVADTGSANAYIANFPANTNTSSLTSGLRVQFKAANANTGTSTLNVQVNSVSIGSATIKLTDGSNLPAGAIVAGALVDVMYDGTNFQLLSDSSGGAEVITNLTVSGNATVAGTTTLTGNLAVDTNVLFVDTANNNVGIGTSSPSGKLDVTGSLGKFTIDSSGTLASLTYGAANYIRASTASGNLNLGAYDYVTIQTGSGFSERMRIDSSGNVGIGLTPITGTTTGKLQLTGGVQLNTNNDGVFGNLYFASGWKYAGNGSAGYIKFGASSSVALALGASANNSSGAGATANPSEILNITSDGLVGIGTSSPSSKLQVACTTNFGFLISDGVASGIFTPSSISTNSIALFSTSNHPLIFGTNNTERMRIDSSGDVGIGAASNGAKLYVQENQAAYSYFDFENSTNGGGIVWRQITRNIANTGTTSVDLARLIGGGFLINNNDTNVANYTAFGIGGSERMRIDSSGSVIVGATTTGAYFDGNLNVFKSGNIPLCVKIDTVSAWDISCWSTPTSGNNAFLNFGTEGTFTSRGSITYNRAGGLTAYNTTSDQRLKENITYSLSALSKIDSVKIRSFDWKETGNHVDFGVIAQELNEVAPECVTPGEDNADGSIKNPWAVDTSVLVPAMIKAIQELKAELDTVKAELNTLKGDK